MSLCSYAKWDSGLATITAGGGGGGGGAACFLGDFRGRFGGKSSSELRPDDVESAGFDSHFMPEKYKNLWSYCIALLDRHVWVTGFISV